MKMIGFIPAKTTSKRVPGKNFRRPDGINTLTDMAIDYLRDELKIKDVFVSTDNEYEARKHIVRECIVYQRGEKYMDPETPVIKLAQELLEIGIDFDYVAICQPDNPVRIYGIDISEVQNVYSTTEWGTKTGALAILERAVIEFPRINHQALMIPMEGNIDINTEKDYKLAVKYFKQAGTI